MKYAAEASSISLSGLLVKCEDFHVLQKFKLNKFDENIQYAFRCVRTNCKSKAIRATNRAKVGDRSINYLKDLSIKIPENHAIIGFELNYKSYRNNNDKDKIFYKYSHCKLRNTDPSKSNQPKINPVLKTFYTLSSNFEKGSIYDLDKHELFCPEGSALTGFGLKTPESNLINYAYSCITSSALKNNETKNHISSSNSVEENEYKSMKTLINLNVECEDGYALQKFKLEKKTVEKQIYYKFICVKVNYKNKITSKTSKITFSSSYIYLNKLNIEVDEGEVLTGFNLIYSEIKDFLSDNDIPLKLLHYKYNTCELIESPSSSNLEKIPDKNENQNSSAESVSISHIKNYLNKGNEFCQFNCVINEKSEIKNCWDGNIKICKKCTIKSEIKDSEKAEVCEAICNSFLTDRQCKFYG